MENTEDYKPKHIILHGMDGGAKNTSDLAAATPVDNFDTLFERDLAGIVPPVEEIDEETADRLIVNIEPRGQTLYDLQWIVNRLAKFGSWQVYLYSGQLSISTYTNRIDREAEEVSDYLDNLLGRLKYTLLKFTDDDPEPPAKWRRYYFRTKSVQDYRPILFNPAYPWWCTSTIGDNESVTIVAYLPVEESLKQYWSDAFDITYTDEKEITFSERFPKPHYYTE